jgi:hypothetical protein
MAEANADDLERLGEVTIPARFNGPERSANGGYACGSLARFLSEPAEVTLRKPPPLDRPMQVFGDGECVRMQDGDVLIAEGRPVALEPLEPPVRPDPAAAEAARALHPGHGVIHPLSDCFVCGPRREDGLGASPGPLPGAESYGATPFRPDDSVAAAGVVPGEIVWAALDCTSAVPAIWASMDAGSMSLLGRLTAERLRDVHPGEDLVVVGWPLDSEGRKQHTASAVLDPDGEIVARARATWVQVQG